MDIRKIKKLIDLLQESGIAEIEIKEGEESVRISRQMAAAAPFQTYVQMPESAAVSRPAVSLPGVDLAADEKPAIDGHVIHSPMVGTLYLGPSPSSPPFVKVGQKVKRGDVICIIEAMKVMNQIETDADGVVSEILVENTQPVQYDQPIIVLQRA
jgi:acetyl-CoA carboxylase biotin carboxyl carrier protein